MHIATINKKYGFKTELNRVLSIMPRGDKRMFMSNKGNMQHVRPCQF